jgi:hypothetical protein
MFDEEADNCPHITYEGEPLSHISGVDTRQPIGRKAYVCTGGNKLSILLPKIQTF